MDGTLALIFLIFGATEMVRNDCENGCLSRHDAPARIGLQVGNVVFQQDVIGTEMYLSVDQGRRYGPFQPTFGLSLMDDGGFWVGYGAKWTAQYRSLFLEGSLMPGYYEQNDSPDIGGNLQFRSALGVGYAFDNGATLTLLVDHRSNADIELPNPGIETIGLRFSVPF